MSVPFGVREALEWCGGDLVQGSAETRLAGVSIDTRTLGANELFVAIRGPNHDAHAYLDRALAAGCGGLVLESRALLPEACKPELPVIAVADTTRALGRLAAGHRRGFDGPLVAITGSNGKTTTKEMCAAILEQRGPCLRNRGNLNNEFGLPLTLLRRSAGDRTVVVEVGMNHRGEIAALAEIARPGVGVITNVGVAHIEHLGSAEAIAQEKGDLVAALPPEGVAVLNAEDPGVLSQEPRVRARVVHFGRGPDAEVRAERVASLPTPGFAFELVAPAGRRAVRVAGLGETTVSNALAASAAALAAGATFDDVAAGLASHRPIAGRMQPVALPGGVHLIDDSYNANPESTEAALRSLSRLRGAGRAVALLGDMNELGDAADAAHRAAGTVAAELDIDFLLALGQHAKHVAEGAVAGGMRAASVHVGESHDQIAAWTRSLLRTGDWVLVKGSRAMQMERVVHALLGGEEPG